ncbi:segregation/condensation protein A [Patescibacteria group bacterium]|nr:segregation/condensation protein A [Patescibacteria group bacterium]
MNSFMLEIKNFSGPIDVLLHMIEKRKLPINDISLSEITDEYIRFVQDLDDDLVSNKTHFIFVAATLTLIKSKSLLPTLDLSNEEEGDINELKRRIALLKFFQDSSHTIKEQFSLTRQFYYPKTTKRQVVFQPHTSISTRSLHDALISVFREVPEKEEKKKEAYVKIAVHIEDMMKSLAERITQALETDFDTFISQQTNTNDPRATRVYRVVGFLAMLELVKNGAIHVLQKQNFSTINIGKI